MAVVVAYDPRWADDFAAEAARLTQAIGVDLVGDVEHIGSTSVRGMMAKPIIDMMAGVADLADGERAEPALSRLGYVRRPHRVDAVRFVKGDPVVTHHLHLTVPGSELWRERLAFRDALRADPELVARYRELKQRLLAETGGAIYDAADKRDFVREVLGRAGHTLRDGMHSV